MSSIQRELDSIQRRFNTVARYISFLYALFSALIVAFLVPILILWQANWQISRLSSHFTLWTALFLSIIVGCAVWSSYYSLSSVRRRARETVFILKFLSKKPSIVVNPFLLTEIGKKKFSSQVLYDSQTGNLLDDTEKGKFHLESGQIIQNSILPTVSLNEIITSLISPRLLLERLLLGTGIIVLMFVVFHQPISQSMLNISSWLSSSFMSPPSISIREVLITPPLYTKLEPFKIDSEDLTRQKPINVVNGAKLLLTVLLESALDNGQELALEVKSKENKRYMAFTQMEGKLFKIEVPLLESCQLKFVKKYANSIAVGKETFLVNTIADEPPKIQVSLLSSLKNLTNQSMVMVNAVASDDYGLTVVQVAYSINDSAPRRETIRRFSLNHRQEYQEVYEWSLSSLPLSHKDKITFWLEAVDNDSIAGFKVSSTEKQTFEVSNEFGKQKDLLDQLSRLNDMLFINLAEFLTWDTRKLSVIEVANHYKDSLKLFEDMIKELKQRPPQKNEDGLLATMDSFYLKINEQGEPQFKTVWVQSTVTLLEDMVYFLSKYIQQQSVDQLMDRAEDFFASYRYLEKLLKEYQNEPTLRKQEMVNNAVEQLKKFVKELNSELSKYLQAMNLKEEQDRLEEVEKKFDQLNLADANSVDDFKKTLQDLMEMYSKSLQSAEEAINKESKEQQEKIAKLLGQIQEELKKAESEQDRLLEMLANKTSKDQSWQWKQQNDKVSPALQQMSELFKSDPESAPMLSPLSQFNDNIIHNQKMTSKLIEEAEASPIISALEGKNLMDEMERRLNKMKQDMKSGKRQRNRNSQRPLYGNALFKDFISLEHSFTIHRKYRDEIINSMREEFPPSKSIKVEEYLKRIVK